MFDIFSTGSLLFYNFTKKNGGEKWTQQKKANAQNAVGHGINVIIVEHLVVRILIVQKISLVQGILSLLLVLSPL